MAALTACDVSGAGISPSSSEKSLAALKTSSWGYAMNSMIPSLAKKLLALRHDI